ncbi:ABC transporter permease [Aerococcaceae bacterium DSM 111022]|nr:ABC transporter permease [Aerococcaceae bacterium DSM 111022]
MTTLNAFQAVHTQDRPLNEDLYQVSDVDRVKNSGYWQSLFKRFSKNKLAVLGLILFIALLIIGLFAEYLAPYDPDLTVGSFQAPPSAAHLLGTDEIGRDVLSRLLFGTRVSLFVGLMSVLIYTVIGTTLGLISGFLGGFWDTAIMRFTEVIMSFPYFMVILVVVAIIGPSVWTVTLVIGLFGWPSLSRLVRAEVLKLRKADYVQAAVASGYSTSSILFKHIFPNVTSPILVNMTFGISTSIITEASLSFLGVGVIPPTASWGNILANAQSLTVLSSQPWRWVPAGMLIFIAVLAVNFVGEGLRSAIEGEI